MPCSAGRSCCSKARRDNRSARALAAIARNARAQGQLIEDLLDMNRIVSGKLRLEVQDVDLARIVETSVDSVRPAAQAKGIRLRTTVDPQAGATRGDPSRLQQIVWNLLSNALKFTPKGGTIDVGLTRVESHTEVTVTDTGVGIDPEFLPHMFERFRQADSSMTRKHGGLGLGLSIVRHLVELHGGTVVAESRGEGHGATFRVALPLGQLRRSTDRNPSGAYSLVDDVSLSGTTVLVVDDDLESRELMRTVLAAAGADVMSAASADDALATLKMRVPHVLVADIGMPGKDGYELIREIRGLAPELGGKVPAPAVTAFARSEDRTLALLAGFQVHIAKPVERHELVVTIASWVGRAAAK